MKPLVTGVMFAVMVRFAFAAPEDRVAELVRSAMNDMNMPRAIGLLTRAAHALDAAGRRDEAESARRASMRKVIDASNVGLPIDTPPDELGKALTYSKPWDGCHTVVLEAAVALLRRASPAAPGVRAALGTALSGLERDAEAWPLLVAEVKAHPDAGACRSELARIALRKGRADLAARVMAPRASVPPRQVLPGLEELGRWHQQHGTPPPRDLLAAWMRLWTGDAVPASDRIAALQLSARFAERAGDAHEALVARLQHLSEGGREDGTELASLVKAEAARGDAARHAVFAQVAAVSPMALAHAPDALVAFTSVAEAESRPEPALAAWECEDPSVLSRHYAAIAALEANVQKAGRKDLEARVESLVSYAEHPNRFMLAEDRAHRGNAAAGEIVLRMGRERCVVNVLTGAFTGDPPAAPELKRFAHLIADVFHAYPPGFLARLDMLRFTLNRFPLGAHVAAQANYAVQSIDIHVTEAMTDDDWRFCLHHEVGHMMDWAVTRYVDPAWAALNAPGFAYLESYEAKQPVAAPPGQLTPYACVNALEDKAEVWAWIMYRTAELSGRAASDPVLAAKLTLWRQRAGTLLPAMDAAWFNARLPTLHLASAH